MEGTRYIGMGVHKDTVSVAVMNAAGKVVMESILETKAATELGYSFIASARSTCGAGCHDENPPGTEPVVKYAS
jgi:hypothetical protein